MPVFVNVHLGDAGRQSWGYERVIYSRLRVAGAPSCFTLTVRPEVGDFEGEFLSTPEQQLPIPVLVAVHRVDMPIKIPQ